MCSEKDGYMYMYILYSKFLPWIKVVVKLNNSNM